MLMNLLIILVKIVLLQEIENAFIRVYEIKVLSIYNVNKIAKIHLLKFESV